MREMIVRGLEQAYDNAVHMIAEFLPRFVVMLIIVLLGLLVAWVFEYILRAILHVTRLDRISDQAGASRVLKKAALPSMTELLSRALFWLTWLAFILIGIGVLQIGSLQEQISHIFQLLPQILIAIVILFVGLLAANFFSRAVLLAAVNAGYKSPQLWSGAVRFVIWILAISMALEQIGLARQTVLAAFSIVFGASMFALAIAFGLGGRHIARQTLDKYLGEKKKEREEEPSPL